MAPRVDGASGGGTNTVTKIVARFLATAGSSRMVPRIRSLTILFVFGVLITGCGNSALRDTVLTDRPSTTPLAAPSDAELTLSDVPAGGSGVVQLRVTVHDPSLIWGLDGLLEKSTTRGWSPLFRVLSVPQGEAGAPRTVPIEAEVAIPDIGFSGSATLQVFIPALPPGRYRIVKLFNRPEEKADRGTSANEVLSSAEFIVN